MSTVVLETQEEKIDPAHTEHTYGSLRNCTIEEFINHQLYVVDEEDHWYIADSFSEETYKKIRKVKALLKQNLKLHAQIIKFNKNCIKNGHRRCHSPYVFQSYGREMNPDRWDENTLYNLKTAYRMNHIMYSLLKGNSFRAIDSTFENYEGLKRFINDFLTGFDQFSK